MLNVIVLLVSYKPTDNIASKEQLNNYKGLIPFIGVSPIFICYFFVIRLYRIAMVLYLYYLTVCKIGNVLFAKIENIQRPYYFNLKDTGDMMKLNS